MSVIAGRRRGGTIAAALAAVCVLAAGCGGDEREPAIGTATLAPIPASALVALHLSTDTGRGPVRVGGKVARRLPSWPALQRDLLRRASADGCGLDLRRRPGDELTFALLPVRGGASTPLLITDAPAKGVRDVPGPCGSLVVRRIGDLVAVGEPAGVQAAADVAAGRRPALIATPAYRRAVAGLPGERLLDAYASARGTRDLLAPLGGLWATLAGLIDTPGLRAAAGALVPRDDGATLVMRRIAVSDVRTPVFRPTLQDVAPADTLTYVASAELGTALERFLLLAERGAGNAPAPAVERFTALSRLGRESATVVGPGSDGITTTLLSRIENPERVRAAMTAIEPDLTRLVGAGGVAAWADAAPGGLRARTLADAPGRALSWAIDGNTLIMSTSLEGITAVTGDEPRLGDARAFDAVTENPRNPITSLVFLDPNQLLRLGADTGIGPAGALEGSRRDLAKVRAIGVTTSGTSRESTVDLSLWIP